MIYLLEICQSLWLLRLRSAVHAALQQPPSVQSQSTSILAWTAISHHVKFGGHYCQVRCSLAVENALELLARNHRVMSAVMGIINCHVTETRTYIPVIRFD